MRSPPLSGKLPQTDALTVRISGQCMTPVVKDGDEVYCDKRRFYLPGDLVVFRNGIGQLACHRFLAYVRHGGAWKAIHGVFPGEVPAAEETY